MKEYFENIGGATKTVLKGMVITFAHLFTRSITQQYTSEELPEERWKGTRMAGRMGNEKVTVKNLEIIRIDFEKNLIFVNGSIPGSNKNLVYLKKSNYEG